MHPALQRFLDGEIALDALPPELRPEAEAWQALLEDGDPARGAAAPPWLESRVMAALPAREPRKFGRRVLDALLQPRTVRVRPASALALGLAVLLVVIGRPDAFAPAPSEAPSGAATLRATDSMVYVQFVFVADGVSSVALAGDFNDWSADGHQLKDPDGNGVWSGLFALPPGSHKYMFVVDGERWVTDPRAERHVDDGFGMRNAMITVTPSAGQAT